MYPNDGLFTNKSSNDYFPTNNLRNFTYSHQFITNPITHYDDLSSNYTTKFIPNIHSNYNHHTFLDLASSNPNSHATLSPTNSIDNPILSLDNYVQDTLMKGNEEDQEALRRKRRMHSNRESARRSRLRKRNQLEYLYQQVTNLVAINHHLADNLNQVMTYNYQILQENLQLRQDLDELQKSVNDLSIMSKGLEEEEGVACNNNNTYNGFRIRASQTITSASNTSTSMDVIE